MKNSLGEGEEMAPREEITCKDLVDLITDYLEGTLTPPERRRFETHLDQCPPCRNYMEQMRGTIRAVGRLSEESLSPAVRDQLLQVFRDWKRK